jgi:alkylation response protein AidB-like acyl-CoA dehydrogenase
MTVERLLPTPEARELVRLAADVADKVLDPIVDEHEKNESYPDGVFATLGETGLLTLPHPEEWGGGGQPYEVYLQVLEELAIRWTAVAVAVSVHVLACHPLITFGTAEQQQQWLPTMLSGHTIGAYSLSEPHAGSDAAALTCKAAAVDGGYRINGEKAWITHGGIANFYSLFARTGEGRQAISCFLVDRDTDGLTFGKPEEKMGLHAIPTTTAHYNDAFVSAQRRIGAEGQGLQIAFSALDSGRLGIARWPSASHRQHSTRRFPTPISGRRSAARSSIIKAWHSYWLTWQPQSTPHAPHTWTQPAVATRDCPTHATLRWQSSSPPTPQ